MASFNTIIIIGYMGADPTMEETGEEGTPVCTFPVATTERRKARGGPVEITTWFRVRLKGGQAELAVRGLSKGLLVYVEGRVSQQEWTDRDGRQRSMLDVAATDFKSLSAAPDTCDA